MSDDKQAGTTIHGYIEEQTSLAKTYAEDGAFFSAARVLRELAAKVQSHADDCYKAECEAMGISGEVPAKARVDRGSGGALDMD